MESVRLFILLPVTNSQHKLKLQRSFLLLPQVKFRSFEKYVYKSKWGWEYKFPPQYCFRRARLATKNLLHRRPPGVHIRCAMVQRQLKNTFQTKVLQGLDMQHDLLNHIPFLRAASNQDQDWDESGLAAQLGPVCFARIAMAAVEQAAQQKKLNPGTAEPLRYEALKLFLSASTSAAFLAGNADVLDALQEQNPAIIPWVLDCRAKLKGEYDSAWRKSALLALTVLETIDQQRSRKGKRGNAGRDSMAVTFNPVALQLDLADSEIIANAGNSVAPSKRNDEVFVRSRIREFVSAAMISGSLSNEHNDKTRAELLDLHTKRVHRKYDELIPKLVERANTSEHLPAELGARPRK